MSEKRWGCRSCTNASHPYILQGRLVRECRKDAPSVGGGFPLVEAEGWCMDYAFDRALFEEEAVDRAIYKAISRREARAMIRYEIMGEPHDAV